MNEINPLIQNILATHIPQLVPKLELYTATVQRTIQCDIEEYCENENIDIEDFDPSDLEISDDYQVYGENEEHAKKLAIEDSQNHDFNKGKCYDGYEDYKVTDITKGK